MFGYTKFQDIVYVALCQSIPKKYKRFCLYLQDVHEMFYENSTVDLGKQKGRELMSIPFYILQ
jgi:hypothetical protein